MWFPLRLVPLLRYTSLSLNFRFLSASCQTPRLYVSLTLVLVLDFPVISVPLHGCPLFFLFSLVMEVVMSLGREARERKRGLAFVLVVPSPQMCGPRLDLSY